MDAQQTLLQSAALMFRGEGSASSLSLPWLIILIAPSLVIIPAAVLSLTQTIAGFRAQRRLAEQDFDLTRPCWSDLDTFAGRWLPDPFGRHERRYHDGRTWTRLVMDGGTPSVDPPEW